MVEQPNGAGTGVTRSRLVRRLRDASQASSGRPRVTVRAYYEGLPSMAGRGTDEGGESRRIMGEEALSSPRKYGPEGPKSPRVERREATRRASGLASLLPSAPIADELARSGKHDCGGNLDRAFRRSAPSHFYGGEPHP